MSSVGTNLEGFFEEQLKLLYPDQTFTEKSVKAEHTAAEPEPAQTVSPPKEPEEPVPPSPKTTSPEVPVAEETAEGNVNSPPKEEPQSEDPVENTLSSEKVQESCSNEETTEEQNEEKDPEG